MEDNEMGGRGIGLYVEIKLLRFYQRSVWQIAVVGQPERMMWVGSDLQFCVKCY